MGRLLLHVVACFLAVLAADGVFRGSVLQRLRPVILAPAAEALRQPPLTVEWDGPSPLSARLQLVGGETRDLGLQASPFVLGSELFPREGSYRLLLEDPRSRGWVRAERRFRVRLAEVSPEASMAGTAESGEGDLLQRPITVQQLLRALRGARAARDRSQQRARSLLDENLSLRRDLGRMRQELGNLGETQAVEEENTADLLERVRQLEEENRTLLAQGQALQFRLGSLSQCTLWGYYAFPRPNTIPPTRRLLLVSDLRGVIFRTQADCELARRTDGRSGSACFCVGAALD